MKCHVVRRYLINRIRIRYIRGVRTCVCIISYRHIIILYAPERRRQQKQPTKGREKGSKWLGTEAYERKKKRLKTENTQIRHSYIYRVRVRDKANDLERKKKSLNTHTKILSIESLLLAASRPKVTKFYPPNPVPPVGPVWTVRSVLFPQIVRPQLRGSNIEKKKFIFNYDLRLT